MIDSEISDNRSLIILVSPQHNDLKYYKPGPDPVWNKYLQQYIDHNQDDISAATLRLISQKTMEIKTLKRTCI